MKNILVTGANGQLGNEMRVLSAEYKEYTCFFTDVAELDICDEQAVMTFVKENNIHVIVNCAAYTAVDRAESDAETAAKINVQGPEVLAGVARERGIGLIHISTDYVFPGTGERFYEPDDPTGPLGAYGSTKLGGELAVKEQLDNYFIVRISWVFGKNGNNFVKTMLRLAETHDTLNVVCDQIGSPTYTADLAPLLCDMIVTEKYGTYHATNEGICSWADFAEAIFKLAGKNVKVNHIPTSEYPTRAVRPLNSRMSKDKLEQMGFSRLPHWKDALERYLKEISENA